MKTTQRQQYIYYAKAFAVLLVLNSHMDTLYPVSAMGAGGALGNCLFFLISGYTWGGGIRQSFPAWYGKKLYRIFVPTIITNILYIFLFGVEGGLTAGALFKLFIYPNKSWFCGAILLYAIFYYFIAAAANPRITRAAAAAAGVIYLIWYLTRVDLTSFVVESMSAGGLCRVSFYFICLLCGLACRQTQRRHPRWAGRGPAWMRVASGVLLYLAALAVKVVMGRVTVLLTLQFVIQIMTLSGAVLIFTGFKDAEETLRGLTVLQRPVRWLAERSWEIYLTQSLIIPFMSAFAFPLGLIMAVVLSLCAGELLHLVIRGLDALVRGRGRAAA